MNSKLLQQIIKSFKNYFRKSEAKYLLNKKPNRVKIYLNEYLFCYLSLPLYEILSKYDKN